MKNLQTIKWIGGILGIVIIVGIIYSLFFKTNMYGNGNNLLIIALAALLIGVLIMFLINKAFFSKSNTTTITESSHTVVESMRKVFKIVTAEGHFNEIYSYEESSKLLGFIPTPKKALVIVHAKALFGYDFEKAEWEINENSKKIILKKFPTPEILSLDTDYKYYNIEETLLNKFSRDDLARIQTNGKKQVLIAAENSNLPAVAAEQMRTLLTEMMGAKDWKLENANLITDATKLLKAGPENIVVNEKKES